MQEKCDIPASPILEAAMNLAAESKLLVHSPEKSDKGSDKKHQESDH